MRVAGPRPPLPARAPPPAPLHVAAARTRAGRARGAARRARARHRAARAPSGAFDRRALEACSAEPPRPYSDGDAPRGANASSSRGSGGTRAPPRCCDGLDRGERDAPPPSRCRRLRPRCTSSSGTTRGRGARASSMKCAATRARALAAAAPPPTLARPARALSARLQRCLQAEALDASIHGRSPRSEYLLTPLDEPAEPPASDVR